MREEIQQLIAEGRTEDALALLVKHNSDAVLLQARYNQAKKQQNMGMIDFGEWSRVQSQVNYAALEMAGQVKNYTPTTVQSQVETKTEMLYINFQFDPSAPTVVVGKTLRGLKAMKEDSVVVGAEIKLAVTYLTKIFGADALPPVVVSVQKNAFLDLTPEMQTRTLTSVLETILEMEADFKEAAIVVGQIGEKLEASSSNVSDLLRKLHAETTQSNWVALRDLVNVYFAKPIFDKSVLAGWTKLSKQVDEVPIGLLWKATFSKSLEQDVVDYILKNYE